MLLAGVKKEGKKLFGEFVLLPHLSFTAAVAVMGRERGLDHIGSRRKELTKNPVIFKTLLRMAVLKKNLTYNTGRLPSEACYAELLYAVIPAFPAQYKSMPDLTVATLWELNVHSNSSDVSLYFHWITKSVFLAINLFSFVYVFIYNK